MSRPKRIDLPWCLYHVLSRTNSGDFAFNDDKDVNKFLFYFSKYSKLFSYRIHSWCIMPNHFHLLIESTSRPDLSELMRRLLTAYTIYFNRSYSRHGHLFQGRFKSFVVDKSGYLLALSRYIHLNPAKMKIPVDPVKFGWSSMKYYAKGGEPEFLKTKEILSWFDGNREKYVKFVNEGLNENTTPEILNQRYIGNEAFAKRMALRMGSVKSNETKSGLTLLKTRQFVKENDMRNAEIIAHQISEYYNISVNSIRKKVRGKGNYGKARCVLTCMLYEYIPWTRREICHFMNFTDTTAISYHLNNATKDVLQKTIKEIKKRLTHLTHMIDPK
jgi:REP-associated tyrosine transposase